MSTPDITVQHDAEGRRYILQAADGREVGSAQYLEVRGTAGADGTERVFFHTVVDEALEGQGLAGRLVTVALDDTIASGARVVPVCPYVAAFVRRHPEYSASVVEPAPEHLAAVAGE